MKIRLKGQIALLDKLFDTLNTTGMPGRNGSSWPVISMRYNFGKESFVYQYPSSYFINIMTEYGLLGLIIASKKERVSITKYLIDKRIKGSIDDHLYHLGIFLIYHSVGFGERKINEDFTESFMGKRRMEFTKTLPRLESVSNDDFLTAMWSNLIQYRETDTEEHRQNPSLRNVRMLFTSDQFASYTGVHYFNADWVEPVSGRDNLECKKWIKEQDPMAPGKIPEGWIEGRITMGHEGRNNGLSHFVQGKAINAGSAIQIRFNKGWIAGRYEWPFDGKNPISIHSDDDGVIYIMEGHMVRIRG